MLAVTALQASTVSIIYVFAVFRKLNISAILVLVGGEDKPSKLAGRLVKVSNNNLLLSFVVVAPGRLRSTEIAIYVSLGKTRSLHYRSELESNTDSKNVSMLPRITSPLFGRQDIQPFDR